MRADWASAWRKVLKPGGLLVTLQYPMGDAAPSEGPPFPVSDEAYAGVLTPEGDLLPDTKCIMALRCR